MKRSILSCLLSLFSILVVASYSLANSAPLVKIDIKPCSCPNSINLKSQGVVAVAIETTEIFDAVTVDPVTVLFAGASPLRWSLEDIGFDCDSADGDIDLLLLFNIQELDLYVGDTEAILTASTTDDVPFASID